MSIFGIGTDIVEIVRITTIISRVGDRLAQRILSHAELSQYHLHLRPERLLAKSFAVKEATVKAFGLGMRGGLAFNQIEIHHDRLGKPYICFLQHAKIMAQDCSISNVSVTLADERQYVVAMVIIEN
ncbi:Holo-[acyl-carrier-protein] synthase [Candidatus Erwinia haradaeae]|uniref:Holo-[acyl-carrier-protein] synthase n=1 Tax=Candidatus Erwinia haradaeae TaxID=1922217 RepID=A0A451DD62_9GAMM|nr:holo-ACP synthase [Candidatus Erwinia haradaeae]VFP84370.1 Holo-[acyl-carrier-protein] synthase [Candidatus Erwinia haradaeae]